MLSSVNDWVCESGPVCFLDKAFCDLWLPNTYNLADGR